MAKPHRCVTCQGSGQIQVYRKGRWVWITCTACKGQGYIII